LAGAPAQLSTPTPLEKDRTSPLRQSTTQPDSQTWMIDQTKPISGSIGQEPVRQSGSTNISNEKTEIITPRAADANFFDAPTERFGQGRTDDRRAQDKSDQTWILQDGGRKETPKRGAGLKIGIGVAAALVLAVAAWAGINQWNEIQRQKALVAEHEQFE